MAAPRPKRQMKNMATNQFPERNFMVTGNHTHQYEQDNPQAGGAVAAPYALVDDETISPQAKAVYLVLARHAGDDGATCVGKDLVARKCGYSKADSVDRYLNELRDKGWLTWRRRWHRDTGQVDAIDRPVYEYAHAPGKGFEPTTNLYAVHDRVTAPGGHPCQKEDDK